MTNYSAKVSYLAAPFTHPNHEIKQKRLSIVNRITFEFHKSGKLIYSPLTHNVPLEKFNHHDSSWRTWQQFDQAMLMRCDELIVLMLPGWENSIGVSAEIEFAKKLGLDITMLDPGVYIQKEELTLLMVSPSS